MITGTLILILSIVTITAFATICFSIERRILMLSELHSRGISKQDAKELLRIHREDVKDLYYKKFGVKYIADYILEPRMSR